MRLSIFCLPFSTQSIFRASHSLFSAISHLDVHEPKETKPGQNELRDVTGHWGEWGYIAQYAPKHKKAFSQVHNISGVCMDPWMGEGGFRSAAKWHFGSLRSSHLIPNEGV